MDVVFLYRKPFFLALFFCFFSTALYSQTQQVSPSYPILNGTQFLDAVPSQGLQLYLSYTQLAIDQTQVASGTKGEVYLVSDSGEAPILLTGDKDLFPGYRYDGQFVSGGNQVLLRNYFLSGTTDVSKQLLIYDITAQTTTPVNISSFIDQNIQEIHISASGFSVYLIASDNAVYRLDTDTLVVEEMTLPERGKDCVLSFSAASSVDKLLYVDCQNRWFIYEPGNDWIELSSGTTPFAGEQHYLSGNGDIVVTEYSGKVWLYSISGNDPTAFVTLQDNFINQSIISSYLRIVDVNIDASKVLVELPIHRGTIPWYTNSKLDAPYVLDTVTGQGAHVSLFNSSLENSSHIPHGFFGEEYYFSFSHNDEGITTYSSLLNNILDVSEDGAPGSFTVQSNAPITVDVTVVGGNLHAVIKRKNTFTQQSTTFLLSDRNYRDEERGLSAGAYEYSYYNCNELYSCNDEPSFVRTLEVLDFETTPELNVRYTPNEQDPTRASSISIRPKENTVDAYTVTFSLFNHEDSITSGVSYDTFSHDFYFSKFCDWDTLVGKFGCGRWSEPLILKTPLKVMEVEVKPLGDLSGTRINWLNNYADEHELYRINGSEAELVYQGHGAEFIDSDLEQILGKRVSYRLLSCNNDGCADNDSDEITLARARSALSISQTRNDIPYPGIQISIDSDYYFDSIEITRINDHDKSQTTLETLPGDTTYYVDNVEPTSEVWYYRAKGCYQEICSYSESEVFTYPLFNKVSLPGEPQNVQFDVNKWFMAGEISWQAVDNVDGYQVKAVLRNGETQTWEVDQEATKLTWFYEDHLGKPATIQVQSFVYEGAPGSKKHFSLLTELEVLLEIDANFSTELASHSFTTYQHFNNSGVNSVTFTIKNYQVYDRYLVYLKSKSDADYQIFPVVSSSNSNSTFTHEIERRLDKPVDYIYKVSACSDFLNKCVWLSHEPQVTFYPVYDLSQVTAAPDLRAGNEGQIIISAQTPEDIDFNHLYIERSKNGYSFREIYSGPLDTVEYMLSDFSLGDAYQFRTRMCVISTSSEFNTGLQCTDYSEPATIEIDDEFEIFPESSTSLSGVLTVNDRGEQSIALETYYWRGENPNNPGFPEFVRIFKTQNDDEFAWLADVEIVDTESRRFYQDSDIEPGTLVRYKIEFCNSAGCASGGFTSLIVPTLLPANTPDIPIVELYEPDNLFDRYRIRLQVPELVDKIEMQWSDKSGEHLYRSEWFLLRDFVEKEGIFLVRRALRKDDLWLSVRACNKNLCSKWSDVMQFQGINRIETNLNLTSDGFLTNIVQQITKWRGENSYISTRYGKLDTYSGDLSYEGWVYFNENSSLRTEVFLHPDSGHNCLTLFSQGLELPREENYGDSFVKPIAQVLYTGNGCQEYPDLELFSYYVKSDYLSEPQLIADKTTIAEQWLDIEVGFTEQKKLLISIDGQEKLSFETDLEFQFEPFYLSYLNWKALGESAISAINVVSSEAPEQLQTSISPWEDFYELEAFHPTAFAFIDNSYLTQVFDVNVWQNSGQMLSFQQRLSVGGANEGTLNLIEGLEDGSSSTFLFNRCNSQQCGPYSLGSIDLPEFSTLRSWNNPYRPVQDSVNILNVSLGIGRGYAETVTLKQKASDQTQYQDVFTEPFIEAIKTNWNTRNSVLVFPINELDPNLTYQFKATICNPVGCLDTEESDAFEVPVDSDNDGVIDENDQFPNDSMEWLDTDGDGIGDNADSDDDNDGISDVDEQTLGLDPRNRIDVFYDSDNDGFTNKMEYLSGSDLFDAQNTPKNYGRFFSFEYTIDEGLNVEGAILFNRYAWHGHYTLISSGTGNHIRVEIPGFVKPGKMYFAARFKESLTITASLGEQELTLTETAENRPYGLKSFSIYTANIEEGGEGLTLDFEFPQANIDGMFELDGIYVPGVANQTVKLDFNGDGRSDIAYRDAEHSQNHSLDLWLSAESSRKFGLQKTDIPVTGDFDGDGKADIAVRRPSNQTWYILRSSDGEIERIKFGLQEEDIPVPADYDGDGITDVAVRRPSTHFWYIKRSSDGEISRVAFGRNENDIPVPADYDGDGKADIAVRRPSNQTWYILRSSDDVIERNKFGLQTADIPVPADFDGDGKADLAVRRPSNTHWYVKQSSDNSILRFKFGLQAQDIPVIADYDGDGKADLAVRRSSTHFWYILNSSDETISRIVFGEDSRFIPVAAPIMTRMEMLADETQQKSSDLRSVVDSDINNEIYEYSKELLEQE